MSPLPLRITAFLSALLSVATLPDAQGPREPNHRLGNAASAADSGGHGALVVPCGDWDGDGHADYAVAAPEFEVAPSLFGGRVYVYSGLRATLITTFDGDQGNDARFGEAMAALGRATQSTDPTSDTSER